MAALRSLTPELQARAVLRERICRTLGWLGLEIHDEANRANAYTISRASSRVRVVVEPTNEEWVAASHALHALGESSERSSKARHVS